MTLKEKITADLMASMKAKEQTKLEALRLLKAAVMKFEVSGDEKKDASDEEVMTIIRKESKQRKDSIDAFRKAGREDLAGKEEIELKILETYLPAGMSEAEVRAIIEKVMKDTGASSKADFGKLMGPVMAQTKGRADGQVVSKLVGEYLK